VALGTSHNSPARSWCPPPERTVRDKLWIFGVAARHPARAQADCHESGRGRFYFGVPGMMIIGRTRKGSGAGRFDCRSIIAVALRPFKSALVACRLGRLRPTPGGRKKLTGQADTELRQGAPGRFLHVSRVETAVHERRQLNDIRRQLRLRAKAEINVPCTRLLELDLAGLSSSLTCRNCGPNQIWPLESNLGRRQTGAAPEDDATLPG
jgi:hypothetical protein